MNPFPRVTFRATYPAIPIWMTTVHGVKIRITARFGIRRWSALDGLPTVTAIGVTSAHGAGRGWTTRPGALLPSTMAAGHSSAVAGAGARVPTMRLRFMALHSWASLAALTGGLASPSAAGEAELDGFRWGRTSAIALGIARATPTTAT